jgi:hypothetical protein
MPLPAALPFIMMGASAVASGIQGYTRGREAKKLEAEYDQLDKNLQPVSPEQYAYLNRVRQLERGMRMGTDPTSAMARRGLAQGLGQTQTNIARMGGGASTVSGLLRAQQGYNIGMGNVAAQAGQQADRMMMYEGGLIDNIQSRIYDLQMKRRNYAQLKAVTMREGAQDATSAAIGALAQAGTMMAKYNAGADTSKTKTKSADVITGAQKATGLGALDLPQGPMTQGGQFNPYSSLPNNYSFGQLTSPSASPNYGFDNTALNLSSRPKFASGSELLSNFYFR